MKKEAQKNITGKIEIEFNGVKYVGTVDLAADNTTTTTAPAVSTMPTKNPANSIPTKTLYGNGGVIATIPAYPVYGVKIARKNESPTAAVIYTDAAADFTAATAKSAGSWAGVWPFNQIKPCLFKDGAVVSYLNPDNYNETDAGVPAAITGGDEGDVMVEFPKIYYRITQDEQFTYVQITAEAASLADGFTDWAYSYKGTVRDKFYIGAYKGVEVDGRLRSLSGHRPTRSKTIGAFRTTAQANGGGYEITPFNKLTLLQALYLIRFKSLDSQAALGAGYVNGNGAQDTGETNAQGFYYGHKSQTSRVKCLGIEDFWGNILEWIDGLITTDSAIKIADGGFGDYENYTTAADLRNSVYGYITGVHGNNALGFLISEAAEAGSDKTHYADYGATWKPSGGVCVPIAGGRWSGEGGAGAFYLFCYNSPSYAFGSFGARLCFCG